MIIQENQLRPPSPREMERRYVQLEHIRIEWQPKCWEDETLAMPGCIIDCRCPPTLGWVSEDSGEFTTLELIEFHKDYQIPYEASVVADGYEGEKALSWSHLNRCPVCQAWYLEGDDHIRDAMHVAVSRAKTAGDKI